MLKLLKKSAQISLNLTWWWSVFAFTLASSLLICVFHSLPPALHSSNGPEVPSTQHVSWKFHVIHKFFTDRKILKMHMFAWCENNSCQRVFSLKLHLSVHIALKKERLIYPQNLNKFGECQRTDKSLQFSYLNGSKCIIWWKDVWEIKKARR